MVITTILSMGDENPPLGHRVLWGLGEGAVAAILLLVGGLAALQTAAIIVALPFSMVMIIMMWGLVKALRQENQYHPQLIQEQYRETFTSQILTEKVEPDTELN